MDEEEKKYIIDCTLSLLEETEERMKDSQGFNKYDAQFAQDLLNRYNKRENLSLSQWKSLTEVLFTYRKQLKKLGKHPKKLKDISFGDFIKKDKVAVGIDTDSIRIDTPYDEGWLNEFKDAIPNEKRRWNSNKKIWTVDAHDTDLVDKALEITEKYFDINLDIEVPKPPFGEATIRDGRVVLDTEKDDDFIEEVKTFSRREYIPNRKQWAVEPISVQEVEKVEDLLDKWEIEIHPETYEYLEERWTKYNEERKKKEKISQLSKQDTLKNDDYEVDLPSDDLTLHPFQKHGVRILDMRGKGLLADDMGLGKTIQTLVHLYNHPQRRPVIVIVPSSVKINWKREILKWTETDEGNIQILEGHDGEILEDKEWYIINYAILHERLDELKNLDYEAVIADESHYVKNDDALRTQSTQELTKNIDNVYCLSGTPMPNRPLELWPQLQILNVRGEDFQSFWGNNGEDGFAEKYCGAVKTRYGWDVKGATNLNELQEKLRENIMIRRKKENVLDELPEKERFQVTMELDNREEYNRAVRDFNEWLEEDDEEHRYNQSKALVKIEKLKQLIWKGKYPHMVEWIEDALKRTEKLVVFAHHKELQNQLYEHFENRALKYTGDMNMTERQEAIDEFTEEETAKLIVVSMQAGGKSINLQVAPVAVFTEIGWTASQLNQCEDRIHRMGQENESVSFYYLMSENTIEETIFRVINDKQKKVDEAIDGISDDSKKGVIMEALKEEEAIESISSVEDEIEIDKEELEIDDEDLEEESLAGFEDI